MTITESKTVSFEHHEREEVSKMIRAHQNVGWKLQDGFWEENQIYGDDDENETITLTR